MANLRNINSTYFRWLYSLIGNQRRSYLKLCHELHKKIFNWSVLYDDNRCEDGKALRYDFVEMNIFNGAERSKSVQEFLHADCTLLEVMIALAKRMDDQMYDPQHGERPSKWFLEMLTNLRLDKYVDDFSDDDRFDPVSEAEIHEILLNLVDRTYDRYGNGSLFPLKSDPPKDMRKVELWYQMMYYLAENYS